MRRRILTLILGAVALAACQDRGPKKNGPAVATGNGFVITAEEFKARLDEQSPYIRARYATLDRKKELLESSLIRLELLAREAERQGLDKDPEVLQTMRKVMVQKLVQRNFADQSGAKELPEADLQKYYDDHKDEFQKPKRQRVAAIVLPAPVGSPDRAKKVAAARKALAQVKSADKANPTAFGTAVAQFSEDPASKPSAGDLGFKSREELERTFGKEVADAAFALKPGELSGVVEGAQGVYVLKVTGAQEEMNRAFDAVKSQIAAKLLRERKTKEFEELVKRLREEAKVTINDAELEKITVAAAPPPGMPGMPGMMPPGGIQMSPGGPMPGGMPPGGPPPIRPPPGPGPVPSPAPPAAPATK
jgi:peptidyl-prolyl cis-trans isomerase C